jgi:hypothetical protein
MSGRAHAMISPHADHCEAMKLAYAPNVGDDQLLFSLWNGVCLMISRFKTLQMWSGLLIAASTLTGVGHAAPQAKPQPKAKPAATTAAKAKPTGVLGMVPMAGLDGKIGQTYTIGQDNPLNFTLNSAEYTIERVNIGTSAYLPNKDEKLLVLRFTVHNPTTSERHYSWGIIGFTAVDAMNQNREFAQAVGSRTTGEDLNMALKPAQKVEAYTVITVPAKGVVPKLIVKPTEGGVVRYDLRGVAKPLSAPFADAADKSGATALEEIPAQADTYYPMHNFDMKLLSTTYADALGDVTPEEGQRFFVATVALRNGTKAEQNYSWGTFKPELIAADDEKAEWSQALLKASRDESAEGTLKPGQEYKARIYFPLPKNVAAKTLTLAEGESHSYAFDVSNTK